MCQHGCSGCTNPQIFGTSPFAPADFEDSSTMCTRCFDTQSSLVEVHKYPQIQNPTAFPAALKEESHFNTRIESLLICYFQSNKQNLIDNIHKSDKKIIPCSRTAPCFWPKIGRCKNDKCPTYKPTHYLGNGNRNWLIKSMQY